MLVELNSTSTYVHVICVYVRVHWVCMHIQATCFDISIDCTLQALEATAAAPSSECGEGEMTASISNGTLCYTGLTPGSTATYSCDKGYELSEGNGPLVCQDDGTWDGPAPTCVEGII